MERGACGLRKAHYSFFAHIQGEGVFVVGVVDLNLVIHHRALLVRAVGSRRRKSNRQISTLVGGDIAFNIVAVARVWICIADLSDRGFGKVLCAVIRNKDFEIVMNLVTGGVLSFWLPNCQIIPEADFTPGNDWANMPFKLEAQIQGAGSTVKRIYRMTEVPAV